MAEKLRELTESQKEDWQTFCYILLAGGEPFDFRPEEDEGFNRWLMNQWLKRAGHLVAFAYEPDGEAVGFIADMVRLQGKDPNITKDKEDLTDFTKLVRALPSTKARGGRRGLAERLILLYQFAKELNLPVPDLSFEEVEGWAEHFWKHGWD